MKREILIIGALTISIAFGNSLEKEVMALDVKDICNVKKHGAKKVVETGIKYNKEAKKLGVEFMRLGIPATLYLKGAKEAIEKKKSEYVIKYKVKKKEKKKKVSLEYGAWRGCVFGVRAVQQYFEAKKTWKMAVPGEGYKF
ncbi:MAG: hypothetical protein GXO02_03170 [Epsilonproteobacteria bacterium]|nr:hypothetical protein [Campylobacterota bacterium]